MALKPYISLLRPKQYLKNTFVFAALVFSNSFRDFHLVLLTFLAFTAMCAVSSATYIVNDAIDVERDRRHPKKKTRPIAAGLVSLTAAYRLAIALLVIGLEIALTLGSITVLILVSYLLLQVLYNWKLKREPVADVFTIALGFVLRAVLGAAAISVPISGWLLFCTGSIALMLGFAKRRHEFLLHGDTARESLAHYNKLVLDAFVLMFAIGASMFYAIYSIQSSTALKYPLLPISVPFVIYGISRYLWLTFTQDEGGEPADLILKDPHILLVIAGFILSTLFILSGESRFISSNDD